MIFLLFWFCAVISGDPVRKTDLGPIGFQIHSFNDLRQWDSLVYRKRARFLKIDPHFLDGNVCRKQKRVLSDEGGCFILNHDKPSLGNIRYDYNTTDDVLDYLVSRRDAFVGSETTFFALCFKSIPLDRCNEHSEWVKLVDDFFIKANEILLNYSLNVEFVLDSGVPAKCHKDRWRPWVSTSTWSEEALFSNNMTLGYDRYQVLNPNAATKSKRRKLSGAPCGDFASCAKLQFGKFANSTTYSFQVYEPSDQITIQENIDIFLNTGINHNPGLRFAINIDPAMFQVYSAAENEMNKKNAAGRSEIFARMAMKPMITRIRDDALMTVFTNSEGIMSYHMGSAYDRPTFRNISFPSTSPTSQVSSDGDVNILFSHLNGDHELYRISLFDTLILHKDFTIANVTSSRLVRSVRSRNPLLVSMSTTIDGCDLTLLLVKLADSSAQVLDSICIQKGISLVNDSSISFDVTKVSDNSYAVLVMYSSGLKLYGTFVKFSVSENMTISFQMMMSDSPRFLAPGRDPSVSLVQNTIDDDVVALVVYADGFCYNNEIRNKFAGIGVCDQVPWSISNVLTYSFGSLQAFEDLLSRNQSFTTCSRMISHGAYDQGDHPVASLFYDHEDDIIRLVELHESLSENSTDVGLCGMPETSHSGSIMLDSWTVTA